MNCAGRPQGPAGGEGGDAVPAATADVHDMVALRITRALHARSRYRYVRPQVRREGGGWMIESPNCSRQVDPAGGLIAIAWFEPQGSRWALHARQHRVQQWQLMGQGLTLEQALHQVNEDPLGRFWP